MMKKILVVMSLAFSFPFAYATNEGGRKSVAHPVQASSVKSVDDAVLLKQQITGKQRSAEHKMRDKYRHPQQTLEFFDVKASMTVVEIWPGEGWYTEILAPYLKDKGKLYTAHFSADSDEAHYKKSLQAFVNKLHAQPAVYGEVELTVLQPPKLLQIAPDGSADRVLTFRNIHNWMKKRSGRDGV